MYELYIFDIYDKLLFSQKCANRSQGMQVFDYYLSEHLNDKTLWYATLCKIKDQGIIHEEIIKPPYRNQNKTQLNNHIAQFFNKKTA